jgi:ribosomal-protein-alanine N-acetyltransferase
MWLAMVAPQADIRVCPLSEDDLDAVLSIESASFSRPWNRSHFLSELHSPHAFPLGAFSGAELLGYICPMQLLDEGQILDVAVAPDHRGKGIGRLLVCTALDQCRRRGAVVVSLEVRISNADAISLYRNIGFIESGRRKGYYENGEDALLLDYRFPEGEKEDSHAV